ncbi:MAG: DUF1018 domain-containing protein [Desulfobacterium sp.]|nr:DUF1018 domain-containing protein [Desulfobacterium sp.]
MISKAKIALIHVAKKQVGMTEAEYRDLLASVNVESSKALNTKTFADVMEQFKKLGFKTKSKRRYRRVDNLPRGKQALMKKLEAMLLDMDLPWAYADSITMKRFKNADGSPIEKAQWLDDGDLYKLVQMIVIHQKRKGKTKQTGKRRQG